MSPNEKIKPMPESSVLVFNGLAETVTKNAPVIKERTSRAISALSTIKKVDTAEEDDQANKILVKCGITFKECEDLRKAYTGPINDWLKEQIIPEKQLAAEMERVKAMRNQRANLLAAQAREAEAKIEKERVYKIYEIQIKNEMKSGVELGVATLVTNFENAIVDMFSKMTLVNYNEIAKRLSITPKIKEELFNSFFSVTYDNKIMSDGQYAELVKRAKGFWKYEEVNATYVQTTVAILKKWRDQIPARIKELQAIASGDTLVEKQAAERLRAEEEERKQKAADALKAIEKEQLETTQEEVLKAEFNAQVQTQNIESVSGVRKKISLRLAPDVDKDMVKVANTISRAILCVLSDPDIKGIYERDKQGFPKRDEKGLPIYVSGIQYWLTQLEKTGYSSMIQGIEKTEEVSTIAKK